MADTYTIKRFRFKKSPTVIRKGVTLEEAQRHCKDPKTRRTDRNGNVIWFDGYEKE